MIVVLMPWRPTTHRIPHYELVVDHLRRLGWPVFTADSGDAPFSSARSYNQAANNAGNWDVAVLHEADVWAHHDQLLEAVDRVGPMTYAYNQVTVLNEAGSHRFHEGGRGFSDSQVMRRRGPRPPLPPGGPRIVTRDLWEKVGGFDPRFTGWGGEDNHFSWKCRQVAGPNQRVDGMLYQLWHPRPTHDPYFAKAAENQLLWKTLRNGG